MSATLDSSFLLNNENLFKFKPKEIHIESKIHPVNIHYATVTPKNYFDATIDTVKKIHR